MNVDDTSLASKLPRHRVFRTIGPGLDARLSRDRAVAGIAASADSPPKLAAVVLLAGSVRQNQLELVLGRSVLDLPVTSDDRVCDFWADSLRGLGDTGQPLPVRILQGGGAPRPMLDAGSRLDAQVQEDARQLRGTAGLLRDTLSDLADKDYVLVCPARQLPLLRFENYISARVNQFDVTVTAFPDGRAAGPLVINCGALNAVPDVGFFDLKEQLLPKLARQDKAIGVATLPFDSLSNLSDHRQYVGALRRVQERRHRANRGHLPSWKPAFNLIEPGATIHEDAVVHDSIILKGAVVERGATVVRSVVGENVVIRRRSVLTDTIRALNSAKGVHRG